MTGAAPKTFISYSWDSDTHKGWVKELAKQLRGHGVDVEFDQWSVVPGDQLPQFMERAIRENSYVLIICTPNYKEKSDGRKGGVGYEGDIMTAEVLTEKNHRKFIPVLRDGNDAASIPSWLKGKYRIDLRGNPCLMDQYEDLLTTLFNLREQAPPVGARPALAGKLSSAPTAQQPIPTKEFEPIKIEGVVADEVGSPRNDGTRGCALYRIPFKLSRPAPLEWADIFVRTWDMPPTFSTMHRPGIAEVYGDRVILTRTTIDEVRDVHRETLKLVLDATNKEYAEIERRNRVKQEASERQEREHLDNIRREANDITFD